eukprot:CAMPEP_0197042854 /NCGR_PEP_ID=MMETSP1384-20130603/19185_1 /TAXON_ID=29189 /ORGANISM="Ammonia sp." /LENGTH=446 /DNA_ID=CAMNT_0042474039 /DNA_START=1 /DNA_END=1338 /DNA_ORIENTATION=+
MPGMMGGVHHVYDVQTGNTGQWRRKMREMLRMMKDMNMLRRRYTWNTGCHQHYGCHGNQQQQGMQHCVFFGKDLMCNMGYPSMGMMNPMMMGGAGMQPMMGGLAPMGMPQQQQSPIVVVHSKNAGAKVKTEYVDQAQANKLRKGAAKSVPQPKGKGMTKRVIGPKPKGKAIHHRRLLAENEEEDAMEMQVKYTYNEANMNRIRKCKVLNQMNEICITYDVDEILFSVDVKRMHKKALRKHERKSLLRNTMHALQTDRAGLAAHVGTVDNDDMMMAQFVAFEPVMDNLGYAIYKYESMDWHSVPCAIQHGNHHPYGMTDKFDKLTHFVNVVEFVYEANKKCSARLHDLPYKLCLDVNAESNQIVLYFGSDEDESVTATMWSPGDGDNYSFGLIAGYVDHEFESRRFDFDEKNDWDEINTIQVDNAVSGTEKCAYLSTSKICVTKNSD